MNNSTDNGDIIMFMKELNKKTSEVCGIVMYFDSVCLLALSISWSVYLITQMMKDQNRYKIKVHTQYLRTNWCRENDVKNYKSNKVKTYY